MRYSLGVWNAWSVLEDAAKTLDMSVKTLTHGGPFWKEIKEAQAIEERAMELERYYASLNVLKNQMPSREDNGPEWNSEYSLYQIQLTYVLMEENLRNALESIKAARCQLDGHCEGDSLARVAEDVGNGFFETVTAAARGGQLGELRDAMAQKTTAMAMFPVTSGVYGEALFFAEAGGKMNRSLLAARDHYVSAQQWIEHHRRMAQAAIKGLEVRLLELGRWRLR